MRLINYANRISKKLTRNHNYIKKELVSNPDFEKPLKIRAILAQVNRVVPAPYGTIYLVDINGTRYLGSI